MMISSNIMMEQNGKRHQGTTSIKTFEYKNTRSDLQSCDLYEEN